MRTAVRQEVSPTEWLRVDLTSTLAAAAPHIGGALVSEPARLAVAEITDRIPAALTRRIYVECRLGADAPRVDVVFCVDAASRGLLLEQLPAWLPGPLRAHPMWLGLGALCTQWAGSRSIGPAIHDVWLEFDTAGRPERGDALVPCVFVGLKNALSAAPFRLWEIALSCVELLRREPVSSRIAAAGRRVLGHLPRHAAVPYVGIMHPRGERSVRLCVSPLAGAALLDFLGAIGWPGEIGELERLLRSIPCGSGRTALDAARLLQFDILNGVQPRIGLEIPLRQHPQMIDGLAERDFLDALCDLGLCSPAKRDALLRWPGHSVEKFPHQIWPSLALRRISHVKLVFEPGAPPEAKTYLSFFHDVTKRHLPVRLPMEAS
jgi:hypothetical protein